MSVQFCIGSSSGLGAGANLECLVGAARTVARACVRCKIARGIALESRSATLLNPAQLRRCTARRNAARASRRVESSVGSGEFASFMISGISVQPSTTASQPSSFSRAMTR